MFVLFYKFRKIHSLNACNFKMYLGFKDNDEKINYV